MRCSICVEIMANKLRLFFKKNKLTFFVGKKKKKNKLAFTTQKS